MKKERTIILLFTILALVFGNGICFAQAKRTIHVATAGTLSSYISEEEKYQIVELTLTGEINGTDFRLLREMAGRYSYSESDYLRVSSFHETDGRLTSLDLSGVKIVAGGEWYMELLGMDNVWVGYLTNDDQIPSYIFLGCSGLKSISFPNSVTSISDHAFDGCSGLISITIPNSVTTIGGGAFQYCTSLTSITIPNSVTFIGQQPDIHFHP